METPKIPTKPKTVKEACDMALKLLEQGIDKRIYVYGTCPFCLGEYTLAHMKRHINAKH